MAYRYRRYQIFRKKLPVPKEVLKRIYNRKATIEDIIQYDLKDKVPTDCLDYKYSEISAIVGMEVAVALDWDTILPLQSYQLLNWFRNNSASRALDWNNLLYKTIKEEYFKNLLDGVSSYDMLIFKLKDSYSDFHFERLGEKFEKAVPELFYATSKEAASDLFSKRFMINDYIEHFKDYVKAPEDIVKDAFQSDVDVRLYQFLNPYLKSGNTYEEEKLLVQLVFSSRYHYEYEKYLEILNFNPGISAHDFLEKACLQRIKEQHWLKPNSYYISKYNMGKEHKFSFGQSIDYDSLSLVDQYPEYRVIFSQFLNGTLKFTSSISDYDSIEAYVAYLILEFNLEYDGTLPEKFKELYPELFITSDYNLADDFYRKKLTPEMIQKRPVYVELLKDKKVFLGFKEQDMVTFIKAIGNDKFFKFCLKYGSHLVPVTLENENQTYEERLEQEIIDSIVQGKCKYQDLEGVEGITSKIPNYFLDNSFPKELRDLFYSGELTPILIKKNQKWTHLMKDKELFPALQYPHRDLYTAVGKENFLMLCQGYGTVISDMYFFSYHFKDMPVEEILKDIETEIYNHIYLYRVPYDDDMPISFKEKYPHLFLPQTISEELRTKFYSRELTPIDFEENDFLFSYFENLDIACYLKDEYLWLTGKKLQNNKDKLKIATFYEKIQTKDLQEVFKKIVLKNISTLNFDRIDSLANLLVTLSYSNSGEIRKCRAQLANQLINLENPKEKLDRIEDIFVANNLPTVGKVFLVFQTLYPDFRGFDFSEDSKVSPILKSKTNRSREVIIFSDLLKIAFGSNNRSIKSYLENIENGYRTFLQIQNDRISLEELEESERTTLSIFLTHLNTLYNNTEKGKKEPHKLSNDIKRDVNDFVSLYASKELIDYDLPDRIIKMFCHFAGFDSFEKAKAYATQKPILADQRNRKSSRNSFQLTQGDFIKGIRDIKYLKSILQNGSLAVEFLGASADKDSTPLDTDLSRILKVENSISETVSKTEASGYGSIYLILKNDDRFCITRRSSSEEQGIDEVDINKIEAFYTGATGKDHYGIRTGFASSEIDYIMTKEYDERIGLEIAMNGFYIPVVDTSGNLIFAPEDYDSLRKKMSGLSYFGEKEYIFSQNLHFDGIEEVVESLSRNEEEAQMKREVINQKVLEAIDEVGLGLKTVIDGNLKEGTVELIDTGSTGRGTNLPQSGDFDFIMRLDKKIIADTHKTKILKEKILQKLGKNNFNMITNSGDFRLKGVQLEGLEQAIDIDITFIEKTDKISYSTDMALRDRLFSIKKQDKSKYSLVLANLLLAKKVLKEASVYKPNRGEVAQGGLGGVGIENWILQNGGSFLDAASSFLEASEGKTFQEFKAHYSIWDFGENHFTDRNGVYPHDEFVRNNMSEEGYLKMKQALEHYLNQLGYSFKKRRK